MKKLLLFDCCSFKHLCNFFLLFLSLLFTFVGETANLDGEISQVDVFNPFKTPNWSKERVKKKFTAQEREQSATSISCQYDDEPKPIIQIHHTLKYYKY